jgi:hypothetical protein
MQIEPAADEPVATSADSRLHAVPSTGRVAGLACTARSLGGGGFALWDRPHLVAGAGEVATGNQAGELLEQEATFTATAEAELADELFVSCLAACGAADSCQQVAVAPGEEIAITAGIRGPGHGLRRAYAGS